VAASGNTTKRLYLSIRVLLDRVKFFIMKLLFTSILILSVLQCYPQLKNVLDLASLKNLTLTELHKKLKEKKFQFGQVSKFDKLKEINAEMELWNHFDANKNQTTIGVIRSAGVPIVLTYTTWDTAFFRTTNKAVSDMKLKAYNKINKNGKLLEQYFNDKIYLMVMNTYMEGNWYFMYYISTPDKEKYLKEMFN